MKASELRIGNLLYFSNGIVPSKIVTVGRRFFSSASVNGDGDGDFEITPYYKPIPLTEEWLFKFGFENKKLISGHLTFIYYSSNNIGIEGMLGTVKPRYCKHVHHLQNLYFALTGEELTF